MEMSKMSTEKHHVPLLDIVDFDNYSSLEIILYVH